MRVRRNKNTIRVLGLDPSFSNFGAVAANLSLDSFEITIISMHLLKTEKRSGKGVRVSSDDLRRAREIRLFLDDHYAEASMVFSEIPSGSQSAKACKALGIAVGVLSCCPLPIIEVTALEVKKGAVGKKTASKAEMIEWATSLYPEAGWKIKKQKGVESYTLDNEHLADAIGVIHAGIATDQFKQVLGVLKSL